MTFLKVSIFGLALLSLPASASTYTVKSGGGGNFTSIQACANAAAPGDTCTVYAGTYNEVVKVPAGTPGNYKTLTVNGSDRVNVYGFVLNSHTKVNGFNITNTASPRTACADITGNATDWYITNNVMYACGGIRERLNYSGTGYGFIQGNKISYTCSTSSAPNVCLAVQLNGDYHLVENNDFSHVQDVIKIWGVRNVFRNNTFHDITTADCGSNSSNCHNDIIESLPNTAGGQTRPSQYNLIEGNTIRNNTGSNAHIFLTQGLYCGGQCDGMIIRFNDMANVTGYGLINDNGGNSSVPGFKRVKSYNNTWVDVGSNVVSGFQNNSTGGAHINDIFYFSGSSSIAPYYVDSSSGNGFRAGSNIAYCGGTCGFKNRSMSGTFAGDAQGNTVANPNFVSASGGDFHLNSGSPAVGAGSALTTVAATDSGTGTALVVTDAAFFQDGNGMPGVEPDWIRVGASTTVRIASINYSTNTITLANSITRVDGDPVYLYKESTGKIVLTGSKPDVGAYPYSYGSSSAPAPPVGLTAVPR